MNKGGLAKDLQRCLRNLPSYTDGQVQMVECDWDKMEYIIIEISPNDGLYKGGRYQFKISFFDGYPKDSPEIQTLTEMYHPNIAPLSKGGAVCVSLFDSWLASNTLDDIIVTLLYLVYHPNLEDPVSPYTVHDMPVEEFESIQKGIIKKEHVKLIDDRDLDENVFKGAVERYEELLPEEWDVLSKAAEVEWLYKLEQEQWQKEILQWEAGEGERRIQKNLKIIEDAEEIPTDYIRTDYAYGKSSLQRCYTVTAPVGMAQVLEYEPPEPETLKEWSRELDNLFPVESTTNEEDMDCSESTSQCSTLENSDDEIEWTPFFPTDNFNVPILKRILTC